MLLAITLIKNLIVAGSIGLIAIAYAWYIKRNPGTTAAEKAIRKDYNAYVKMIANHAEPGNYNDFKDGIQEFIKTHNKVLPAYKVEYYSSRLQQALDNIMQGYVMT
jgi:hypothetical protein